MYIHKYTKACCSGKTCLLFSRWLIPKSCKGQRKRLRGPHATLGPNVTNPCCRTIPPGLKGLGEYVSDNTILDLIVFERRSKQYEDGAGQTVEQERDVTGTQHAHSTFIILNVLCE